MLKNYYYLYDVTEWYFRAKEIRNLIYCIEPNKKKLDNNTLISTVAQLNTSRIIKPKPLKTAITVFPLPKIRLGSRFLDLLKSDGDIVAGGIRVDGFAVVKSVREELKLVTVSTFWDTLTTEEDDVVVSTDSVILQNKLFWDIMTIRLCC